MKMTWGVQHTNGVRMPRELRLNFILPTKVTIMLEILGFTNLRALLAPQKDHNLEKMLLLESKVWNFYLLRNLNQCILAERKSKSP